MCQLKNMFFKVTYGFICALDYECKLVCSVPLTADINKILDIKRIKLKRQISAHMCTCMCMCGNICDKFENTKVISK